jgi:hypothetical protein
MSHSRLLFAAAAVAAMLSQASALYSAGDDVLLLDEKNFDKTGEHTGEMRTKLYAQVYSPRVLQMNDAASISAKTAKEGREPPTGHHVAAQSEDSVLVGGVNSFCFRQK